MLIPHKLQAIFYIKLHLLLTLLQVSQVYTDYAGTNDAVSPFHGK